MELVSQKIQEKPVFIQLIRQHISQRQHIDLRI